MSRNEERYSVSDETLPGLLNELNFVLERLGARVGRAGESKLLDEAGNFTSEDTEGALAELHTNIQGLEDLIVTSDNMIYQYMDTIGDGTGTKNANGDYSAISNRICIRAPINSNGFYLYRLIIIIQDGSGFRAEYYGGISGGLTNGWRMCVNDNENRLLLDITQGVNIKTNAEIGRLCYDVDVKTWGAGDEALVARLTFARAGSPIWLKPGDYLFIEFKDDLSGLIEHYFMIQGIKL